TANVSYIVDGQHRFVYCNPAWDQFAESNGAPRLAQDAIIGRDLFDSVPSVLQDAYANAFRRVAHKREMWTKSYECSSPTVFRKYRMNIYPMERWDWFLVTNSLLVTRSHRKGADADDRTYFAEGIVKMCAHCRCSQRVDIPNKWDFVPKYLQFKGLDCI